MSQTLPPIRSELGYPFQSDARPWKWPLIGGGVTMLVLVGVTIALLVVSAPPGKVGQTLIVALFIVAMFAMMLAPIAGILLLAVVLNRDAHRRQLAAFSDLAAQVGGEVVFRRAMLLGYPIAQAVVFSYGKTSCVLDVEVVGSGKHRRHYTRVTFDLARFIHFDCRIAPENALSLLGSWFGGQDVRLGWEEFDKCFVVKTNDELRAPDVLHQPVQQALLTLRSQQLKHFGYGTTLGYLDLRVQGRHVQFRSLGRPTNAEQLFDYCRSCAQVFDLLAPRLS